MIINTSNSVCLALLGIPPLETILHKKLLSMYVNIFRNEDSIEYEVTQKTVGYERTTSKKPIKLY